MKRNILSAVLALGLVATPIACGPKLARLPDVPATVTPAVNAAADDAEQTIYAGAMKALGMLGAAGVLVKDITATESRLNQTGQLTPGVHAGFVAAIGATSRAALDAIDKIEQGVETWAELRTILQSVLTPVQGLIDDIAAAGTSIKNAFGDVLTSLPSVIRTAMPGGVQ
jgi:hypothetical protein